MQYWEVIIQGIPAFGNDSLVEKSGFEISNVNNQFIKALPVSLYISITYNG